MPVSTVTTSSSLQRSRSVASIPRKSAHRTPVRNKRVPSPSPTATNRVERHRRPHQQNVRNRRATSPVAVTRTMRRQSPVAVASANRRRQSPAAPSLTRSHSTGSLTRASSVRRPAAASPNVVSRRAQKKARAAAAARRLARSKSANAVARKKAAATVKSASSARTRSQYHIQPMAFGAEPVTGPVGPTAGLFRRQTNVLDKLPAMRGAGGGLAALFGKKSPAPAALAIAPSPTTPNRPSPITTGGPLDKALVPRAAPTMRSPATQALVLRGGGRAPLTLAQRKRAMALASRANGNTRRLRTVRYGASAANGSMIMRRAVMASGGGIRVGPAPVGFPGINGSGGSSGLSGLRTVILDGESIGISETGPPPGFEGLINALMYYKRREVDTFAMVDAKTVEDWEMESPDCLETIAQLQMSEMLLVPPEGSNYIAFLLKIAHTFRADIVSNNPLFKIAFELDEEEPLDFLDEKLVPFMIVRGEFIPHPEEGRLLSGLHGPRPRGPMLMDESGEFGMNGGGGGGGFTGALRPISRGKGPTRGGPNGGMMGGGGGGGGFTGALRPISRGKGPTRGGLNGGMGLPPGARPGGGALSPMNMRTARRVAAARTRNRNLYQSRMRTRNQQHMQQRRKQVTITQLQNPQLLRITR